MNSEIEIGNYAKICCKQKSRGPSQQDLPLCFKCTNPIYARNPVDNTIYVKPLALLLQKPATNLH